MLDLLELRSAIPTVSGRSLVPALRGETLEDEATFAESLVPLVHYGWSDLRALRLGSWKYILAPRPELYDLERDPGERQNRIADEPARARSLRNGLEQRLQQEQAALRDGVKATAAVPPDLLEKLGALGYVGGGGSANERASGADPKDKIEEYKILNTLMREGLINLREQRFAASLDRFNGLFQRGVNSFESHYYAARALTGLKRWRDAATHYEGAIRQLPSYSAAYLGLAEAHLGDGKPALALEAVRRGQKVLPDDPRLIDREGDIARGVGDLAVAGRSWERVARMAPQDALVRVKLGELYRDAGRPADAVRSREARPFGRVVLEFARHDPRWQRRSRCRGTGVPRGDRS
jgi:tetratricopeptide (TPR) repeat protein